jgi:hypothetical protein
MAETGIPYFVAVPNIGSFGLFFNGYDVEPLGGHVPPYYRIEEVEGLDASALRTPTEERPQRDGLVTFPFLRGGRYPGLRGKIIPRSIAERRRMEDLLRAAAVELRNFGGVLKWRPSAAVIRWKEDLAITNGITDALRAVGTEGDGRAAEGTVGVWEATTNIALQSNVFDNAAWVKDVTLTVTPNSILDPGGVNVAADLATWTSGTTFLRQRITVTASTSYTVSFWVKRGSATDLKYSVFDVTNASDIVAPTSYYSQTSATVWKRIEVTFTTPAGCTSIDIFPLKNPGVTGTAYFAWAQLEAHGIATPYVATAGSSATRAAASVVGKTKAQDGGPGNPISDRAEGAIDYGPIDPAKGWFAISFRPSWPATADPIGGNGRVYLLSWRLDATHRISVFFDPADDKFKLEYQNGIATTVSSPAQTFAKGDLVTLVAEWGPILGIAVNQGPLTTTSYSNVFLDLSYATYQLGSSQGANQLNGEIHWVAFGLGTLTDHDVTVVYDSGNHDEFRLSDLMALEDPAPLKAFIGSLPMSEGALPSMLWQARTGAYDVVQVRRCSVQSYEQLQISSEDVHKLYRWGMIAAEPLIFSEIEYSGTDSGSPFSVPVANVLDEDLDYAGLSSLYPKVRVVAGAGGYSAVDIHLPNGTKVRLTGISGLGNGDWIDIDFRRETVLRFDGIDLSGKIDPANSSFSSIAPGSTTSITIDTITGTVSALTVFWRLVFAA